MATTMRGNGVGKEKRITSPSSSTTKRSPKPLSSSTKPSSSPPSGTKTSSTLERKPIPNSSRPTESSKIDPSKAPKKSGALEKPASKPALERRRSLDRPPASLPVQPAVDRRRSFDRALPSSQVQRAVHNGPTTRDGKTLRSSFSSKSTTTPLAPSGSRRPVASTSVSSRKVSTKGDPPVSRPGVLRRSASANNTAKDSAKGRSLTKKSPERETQEGTSVDYETRSDSHLMNEDSVLVNIDSELESLPEISDMNETASDLGDPTNTELEVKQPPVEPAHTETDTEDENNQEVDKLVVDDQISDEAAVQESIPHDQEVQITGGHSDEDIQEAVVEETTDDEKQIDSEKQEESNVEPMKEEAEKVIEEVEVNGEQQTEGDSSTDATATVVIPSLKSYPSWKKENQAYNDVIEETATKLRLKKNKVLALAGAFETVISLQDTNKH